MRRFLLGTLISFTVSMPATAQFRGGPVGPAPRGGPAMHSGFGAPVGGGFRMVQAPPPARSSGFVLGVGLGSGYGYGIGGGYRGGYGGGFITGGLGYAPYYVVPQPTFISGGGAGGSAFIPTGPSGATAVSGVLPATLVIDFPAAAKVWLNGVEVPGDPDTSWTFTSRPIQPGDTATFRVRGRWTAGGKTFESEREVPLGPGARSRLLVVSGTEVKQ